MDTYIDGNKIKYVNGTNYKQIDILKSLSFIYNVDESIIKNYKDIYNEYPYEILYYTQDYTKIERNNQRILNIVRTFKLNKIIKK